MIRTTLKFIKILCITVVILYLCVCTFFYFKQDAMLFHPKASSEKHITELLSLHPDVDTISFTMKDGTKTCGFISKTTDTCKVPLVLYFGGNAEEVSHLINKKSYVGASKFALLNYRGFGLSEGQPSEKTMFSDALEIYDQLASDHSIDSTHIIVIGRSIGTGVATYLSAHRKIKATILITPYESMSNVAQKKYPFVPVSLLIQHPFNSKEYAKTVGTPALALIAKNDMVIPKEHAYALMRVWKGETTSLELDEDHQSIINNEVGWKAIQQFISENSR